MFQLKDSCTMAIVTHNMQQAARASDFTAFMLDGKLIEHSDTSKLFTTPTDPRTEAYITGRFGYRRSGALVASDPDITGRLRDRSRFQRVHALRVGRYS